VKRGKGRTNERNVEGPEPKRIVLNALKEAFHIHARILIGFVYNRGQPDEMRAKHYLPQWKRQMPQGIRQLYSRLNKMIMHLTRDRVALYAATRKWPVGKLMTALARPLVDFHKAVQQTNPALLVPAVSRAMKRCAKHLV
jgi:hypothetical protein